MADENIQWNDSTVNDLSHMKRKHYKSESRHNVNNIFLKSIGDHYLRSSSIREMLHFL